MLYYKWVINMAKIDENGTKICLGCGKELPATLDYYRSNGIDGISARCRVCYGGRYRIKGYIICSVCGKKLLATTENFAKKKGGRYGLDSTCKECYHNDYENNKEQISKNRKIFRKENTELVREKERIYWNKNKKLKAKKDKRYRLTFKGKQVRKVINEKRRTLKRNLDCTLTNEEWNECLEFFNYECAYCGSKENISQDHFTPLTKGGGFTIYNVLPACTSCNSSKGNRDFIRWYKNKEFYDIEKVNKIKEYFKKVGRD